MMKISIVIPAFNCSPVIGDTIKSVIESGLSDFEILIVDDGSFDGTADICDALADSDSRIRCVHQNNAGVSAARNRGIREASGDYIWFVDADDSVKANSMQQIGSFLQSEFPDMLVFGLEFDYFHKGRIYRRDELLPATQGMKSAEECSQMLYALFRSNSLSSLCTRLINRKILLDEGLFLCEDMRLYEDLEFVLRIHHHCKSVFFYPEAIYQYHQSEDEGNAGRRLKRISHIPGLVSKIETALGNEEDRAKILLSLYLTLAREKIGVSSGKEIQVVCDDFKAWIDENDLFSTICQKQYPMMIYHGQVTKLITKRSYSKLRHSVANFLKRTIGDFREWSYNSVYKEKKDGKWK